MRGLTITPRGQFLLAWVVALTFCAVCWAAVVCYVLALCVLVG